MWEWCDSAKVPFRTPVDNQKSKQSLFLFAASECFGSSCQPQGRFAFTPTRAGGTVADLMATTLPLTPNRGSWIGDWVLGFLILKFLGFVASTSSKFHRFKNAFPSFSSLKMSKFPK